jgi:hypothetical protein
MVTEALQPVLGNRVIGICDSASGLVARAAAAAGIPALPGSLVGVDYLGLNHLGWLRGLHAGGEDRLPALLADPVRLSSFEEGAHFRSGPAAGPRCPAQRVPLLLLLSPRGPAGRTFGGADPRRGAP